MVYKNDMQDLLLLFTLKYVFFTLEDAYNSFGIIILRWKNTRRSLQAFPNTEGGKLT
jgi:hypothetical protein